MPIPWLFTPCLSRHFILFQAPPRVSFTRSYIYIYHLHNVLFIPSNVNSSSITTAPFVQNRTSEAKTSYHDNERKGCECVRSISYEIPKIIICSGSFAETSTFHRSDEIPSRKYMTYMPCNFPGCSNSIVPGRVYCLSHRGCVKSISSLFKKLLNLDC